MIGILPEWKKGLTTVETIMMGLRPGRTLSGTECCCACVYTLCLGLGTWILCFHSGGLEFDLKCNWIKNHIVNNNSKRTVIQRQSECGMCHLYFQPLQCLGQAISNW